MTHHLESIAALRDTQEYSSELVVGDEAYSSGIESEECSVRPDRCCRNYLLLWAVLLAARRSRRFVHAKSNDNIFHCQPALRCLSRNDFTVIAISFVDFLEKEGWGLGCCSQIDQCCAHMHCDWRR